MGAIIQTDNINTYEERMIIMNEEKTILPSNVRQIGSITGDERIYMEDYACTYLQQYAAWEPNREKAALLVGRACEADGEKVLFISGVIQGKYAVRRGGITELTEKTWQYAKKQLDLYFDGLEIVGWAYIQPGFEDYLSDGIMDYQRKNADRGLRVLFLNDPAEKLTSFFKWDSQSETFSTVRGYLVYYEKNEGMHEYMLENKIKAVVKEDTASKADEPTTDEKLARTVRPEGGRARSKVFAEQKRLSNLLGSVSFVMLLVCFVMGAGLIRSDERISTLEQKITLMQNDIDGVQSVFASQNNTQTTQVQSVSESTTQATTQTTTMQSAQKQEEYTLYTVESGDTILKICKNEYGSGSRVDEIMELNGIDDPSRLYVGMELKLPKE